MKEVSGRAIKALLENLPSAGIPLESAVEGAGVPLDSLLKGSERVDWTVAVRLLRNVQRLLGGEDAAADYWGRQFAAHKDLTYISRAAGLFASPYAVFKLGADWFSPSISNNLQFKLRRIEGGRLELTVRIPEAYEDCPEYFAFFRGALPGTTCNIGLPPSQVTMKTGERCAVYEITPPPSRTLWDRARSVQRLIPGISSMVRTLREQNEELARNYAVIEAQANDLRGILDSIRDGVIVVRGGIILYANPAIASLVKARSAADLVGTQTDRWVAPNDIAELRGWAIDPKDSSRRELELLITNGSRVLAEVTAPREISWRNEPAVLWIMRDITPQRGFERAVTEARERERSSIARDMHDGLGQQLVGIALKLKVIEGNLQQQSSPETQAVTQMVDAVNLATSHVRDIARGMAPPEVFPEGLVPALRYFAATCSTLYRTDCTVAPGPELPSLGSEVMNQLYRACQEAVLNSVRHGQARAITIGYAFDERLLTVSIRDNGCGFGENHDPSGNSGMGLRIMRHRLESVGGSVAFRDAENPRGAVVEFRVPLSLPRAVPEPWLPGLS